MVWYSHHFQNFPQFVVMHTVKGFGVVNKAEVDVFPVVMYGCESCTIKKAECQRIDLLNCGVEEDS